MSNDLAAELAGAFLTRQLTDDQRAALIVAGSEVTVPAGETAFVEGEPADLLWILLDGEVRLSRLVGREVQVMATMTTPGQWAGGLTAWGGADDATGYRGTGTAVVDCRFLTVPSTELARLVEEWFPFGMHLTTGIFQTVRGIDAVVRQRASLIALGTMAAGLAHEINNPAAAARSAVSSLRRVQADMVTALTALPSDRLATLEELRSSLGATSPVAPSALARARAEDEVGDLLASRDVDDPWVLAPELVAAGLDAAACERVSSVVGGPALGAALRWIAAAHGADALLDELAESTRRIADLVGAVGSFSQVDRASVQRIDLHEGIESTLLVLGHKLRDVTVVREMADDLPVIEADPGQLNQVWTNLIDNAVDAMDGRGTVTIRTRAEADAVVVEIADTGPGIDPDVRDRIFEPFFTTKDVGQGTGLGLDITRRIVVDDHHGTIDLTTAETGTTFLVRLPR